MGPIVCSGLKKDYPDKVACQGVGKPYTGGLADNVGTVGTTQAAIGEATKMFTTADSKCPDSVIVFGGYRYILAGLLPRGPSALPMILC